jgi:hypothetical protein
VQLSELGLGGHTAYRERVDLVGAALLEGVVVPRSPGHGSFPPGGCLLRSEVSRERRTRPGALGGRGSAERQEGEEAEDAAAQLDLCSCFVYCVLPPTANAQKTETV